MGCMQTLRDAYQVPREFDIELQPLTSTMVSCKMLETCKLQVSVLGAIATCESALYSSGRVILHVAAFRMAVRRCL